MDHSNPYLEPATDAINEGRQHPARIRLFNIAEELAGSEPLAVDCPNGLPAGHCGDDPDCQHPPCIDPALGNEPR